jgi:1,2-diacylglycerol 3-alpha-glucosyltransferase
MTIMRIAFFTDSFYPELGGIQDSIAALCRGLGAQGHKVLVCAPAAGPRDHDIAGLPRQEIDLGANVVIRRLPSLPAPSSTGQSRLTVPTGRCWRPVADFEPDVVHSHTFLGAGWEAVRTARRLGAPLVGTNHWFIGEFADYVPIPAPLFRQISVRAVTAYYNQCDFVTGPSRCVIDELRSFGLRSPCAVLSNPIDTMRFSPASHEDRSAPRKAFGFPAHTIIYAGRLAVEKRIDVLIRAVARLRLEFPDVMLVLAGHGKARKALERLAHKLDVTSHIRFLGTLNASILVDAYRAAHVFATASTSETQCMAMLQAMSAGLPAVGARWRALPEYIPETAGLLADPGNDRDFADKLGVVLRNPSLREDMGRHAARFVARLSLAAVVNELEEIYVSMAGRSHAPRRSAAGCHVAGQHQTDRGHPGLQ